MSEQLSSRLRILAIVFVGVLVLIGLNSWLVLRSANSLEKQSAIVERSYEINREFERMFSYLKDAETGLRGYLLSLRDDSLEIHKRGIQETLRYLERLEKQELDPSVQSQFPELVRIVNARIAMLNKTLALHQAKAPRTRISSAIEDGQRSMMAVRDHIDTMTSRSMDVLRARQADANREAAYLQWTLIASSMINVLLIGILFTGLRRNMFNTSAEAAKRAHDSWLKEGVALMSQQVGGDQTLSSMANRLATFLAEQTGVPGVNFYSQREGELQLEAGYGYDSEKQRTRARFRLGEGLVGRAAVASGLTKVNSVPSDFFQIESGMGGTSPHHLTFVPLRFRDETVGLIEIASFHELERRWDEWLMLASEAAAAGLNSAHSRRRLQELLEKTQRQSEELQSQQEELRTTNEELEEQAKALLHSQEHLQVQTEELRQLNEELEQQTRHLEEQRQAVTLKNDALEKSKMDLTTKATELERASQYKSEFLAKMSHELRTPLNSLMILSTILTENKQGNLTPQQVEFARTITGAGVDLLDLINDILDLSKLEARKLTAHPEPFSLSGFVEQMITGFGPQAETKGIALATEIAPGLTDRVVTDRQRLQQIIRNLVANALKFTEQGEIKIKAEPSSDDPSRFRISVIDTGIGIPEGKKRLIWEAFEQVDGSVSRRYGGTGLGLTISRELAGLLDGHISMKSEEGKGSQFIVELPIEMKPAEAPVKGAATPMSSSETGESWGREMPSHFGSAAASAAPLREMESQETSQAIVPPKASEHIERVVREMLSRVPSDAKTILVVEDDDRFRKSVCEAASDHGFECIPAANGETALEVLKNHVPHAILLDIKLPGVSGMALLDLIKKMPRLRHIPIHMMSALEHQQSALRLGAIGYLGKPVTIDGVRSALNRIESVIDQKVKRLLVVEDDQNQRKAIAELVGGSDTEIVAVGEGRKALEILSQGGADCVILDLKLPDMSGFELLEKLDAQEGQSLPPIIVYTGKDLSRGEEEQLRRYSDSIIIKGAKSPGRLLDEVNLFLHRVESDLPEEKRTMLADLRTRESSFEGRNVLLVDDDLRNVFALTSALEAKGFNVNVARNGIEALEKLEQHPETEAVLMDIMMPKMDGFEAMRRIRGNIKNRDLPVIALTAKAMKGEYERCVEAGASDYLPKPVNLGNLMSVLKVWLPNEGVLS